MGQEILNALVEPLWLKEHLNDPETVVLDTSVRNPIGMHVSEGIKQLQIPGSRYFDLDGKFSDSAATLPHMMPDAEQFNREAQALGINDDDLIILYDNVGIYSSPRVWWMFRAMGHENVAVLDGGFIDWVHMGLPTEGKKSVQVKPGNFKGKLQKTYFRTADEVYHVHHMSNHQILDARSIGRFFAKEPEPRPGLRGGHIPNSKCLPFQSLLDGHRMKDSQQLQQILKNLASEDQQLVFSCGSGMTACILALGAYQAGYRKLAVYDGSWSEWGAKLALPVSI